MSDRKVSMIRNTGLSYAGQAYAMLIGILILPFYLGHLGAEAYGLIGFFAVMQVWLQLLDAGLSPSLVRQIAHFRGRSAIGARSYEPGQLLRSFEIIFLPLTALTVLGVHFSGDWIAQHWLQAQELDTATIVHCISLMGLVVGLKLYATLYKSGLQGLELHAWLNGANVLIATLRYFGGLCLVANISEDPVDFFLFQTVVALIETLIFAVKAYVLMPSPRIFTGFNWPLVKPVLPFAASISLTSVLWILLTQLDKVLLSNVLLLKEYGYFSLVALMATGIMTLTNPLVQTLLPRMTVLVAEGRIADMQTLYLNATRFVCSLLFPLTGVVAFHSAELVFAWTGDVEAAQWSRTVLPWYVIGSAIMAITAFQFYLQYAYGRLRLHVWFSLISAAISIPVVIYAALAHGVYGAALAWFGLRIVTFLIWPSMVHKRFGPSLHRPWLQDLLRITAMTGLGLLIGEPVFDAIASDNRFDVLLGLAVSGLICMTLVTFTTKPVVMRLYVMMTKSSA
ncbi:lipopolysaccharide biosynthesis protein [Stutzerimonas zhaodongensis]|nr:oligosaccharide flippase family protein [Stutzerimonas zhaodongensis]MCQ4314698.1 oligosaccharide flippase family protein [Stutzerimonas zhaodongensis]